MADSKRNSFVTIVRTLLWLGVLVAAPLGAWTLYEGVYLASSAPQQAAAAAMGLATAAIPYVFARAFDEITDV